MINVLERLLSFLRGLWRADNLGDCDTLLQSQQLSDHLMPSAANAIGKDYQNKLDSTSQSQLNKYKQTNSNTYEYYLCDYKCDGDLYSVEILANSFESAERHLQCLRTSGKIVGKAGFKIPVPIGETLITKIAAWFKSNL